MNRLVEQEFRLLIKRYFIEKIKDSKNALMDLRWIGINFILYIERILPLLFQKFHFKINSIKLTDIEGCTMRGRKIKGRNFLNEFLSWIILLAFLDIYSSLPFTNWYDILKEQSGPNKLNFFDTHSMLMYLMKLQWLISF